VVGLVLVQKVLPNVWQDGISGIQAFLALAKSIEKSKERRDTFLSEI
jgi:hypothetical protein